MKKYTPEMVWHNALDLHLADKICMFYFGKEWYNVNDSYMNWYLPNWQVVVNCFIDEHSPIVDFNKDNKDLVAYGILFMEQNKLRLKLIQPPEDICG